MSTMRKMSEGGSDAELEVNDCKADAPVDTHEEDAVISEAEFVAIEEAASSEAKTTSSEGISQKAEETLTELAATSTSNPACPVGWVECHVVHQPDTVTPRENVTQHSGGTALDLHWLLKTANPNWTTRELTSAREKLKQVGITTYEGLDETLQGKGILNNILRDQGLKAFGTSTLDRLRNAVESEKERQRQATLLVLQRERRRLDQETRSGKAILSRRVLPIAPMAPRATLVVSTGEGPQLPDSTAQEDQHDEHASFPSGDSSESAVADDKAKAYRRAAQGLLDSPRGSAQEDQPDSTASCMTPQPIHAKADMGGAGEAAGEAAEGDFAAEGEGDTSALESDTCVDPEQYPSQFRAPSEEFRHGLADGLSCGLSWEWPMTRDEKKERITVLDRQVLQSYKQQLEDLQAKVGRKERSEMDSSRSFTEGEDNDPSSDFSPEIDSELGIHIAG